MKTIRVKCYQFNDSDDVKIFLLNPIDKTKELRYDLIWYSGSNRPKWHTGQELSDEELMFTKAYKAIKFSSIVNAISDDCAMSIF